MTVAGHYPSTPQLNSSLGFIREGGHLSVSSITIKIGSAPGKEASAQASPASAARNDPASSPPKPAKVEATTDGLDPSVALAASDQTPEGFAEVGNADHFAHPSE
jgi:hypothetical protein